MTYLSLWSSVAGALSRDVTASGPMLAAAFRDDGRYLALALGDGTVSIRDIDAGSETCRLDVRTILSASWSDASDDVAILAVSFSPDGALLGTATFAGSSVLHVHMWNVSELLGVMDVVATADPGPWR